MKAIHDIGFRMLSFLKFRQARHGAENREMYCLEDRRLSNAIMGVDGVYSVRLEFDDKWIAIIVDAAKSLD